MYAITGITGKVGGAARKGTITLDQAITALVREAQ